MKHILEDTFGGIQSANKPAPFFVKIRNSIQVGFDDVDIAVEKAFYVAEEELGGIMFWTIDNDDFRGICSKTPYPLIESAKEAMYSVESTVKT